MSAGPRAALLVDGRSGSGKTELARAIVDGWPEAQLLRMDDLYPGWTGLAAGASALPSVLAAGRWQRWDWAAASFAEEHTIDPMRPLVVEGVGALTRASRRLAALAVWIETDDALRRTRALSRDAYFAPHWEAWAAQEIELIEREHPQRLADAVLPGDDVALLADEWRARARAGDAPTAR